MIIDIHTHIFPKRIRDNRQNYFSSESAFKLLYESPGSALVSADETIATMDAEGVDRSVVFGFPWRDITVARETNDYVMESVNRFPDRLIGFCCLDPADGAAEKEVERCLDGGLSGVGELAFYESGIDTDALEQLTPIMETCRERGVPVMIHTNEPVGHPYPGKTPNTLAQIYQLISRFPKNTIILAHWGGGVFFYHLLRKEVKEALGNVYFDTAASPFLYGPAIYRVAIEIMGAEKILFGTDFPLLKPSRYFKEIDSAKVSESDIQKICGGNAQQLLNLEYP